MLILAVFIAFIVWLGNKRGMDYLGWLMGYGVLVALAAIIRVLGGNIALEIVVEITQVVYLVTFLAWPHLVGDAHKKALDDQAKANLAEAATRAEDFYRTLDDWLPVKVYTDPSQIYELQADRATLDAISVVSFAKTSGITTLFVPKDEFAKAADALGIEPLEESPVQPTA